MDLLLEDRGTEINLPEEYIRSVFSLYNDPLVAFEAIGHKHEARAQRRKISSTNYRKHNGIYYTPYAVAKRLIQDLLDLENNDYLLRATFLDPCVGHGIFIIAYIDAVVERLSLTTYEDFQNLVDRLYYADNDRRAIELLRISVPIYIEEKYNVLISLNESNSFVGNTLFSVTANGLKKNNLKEIFGQTTGFSIIATNPPYKLLKVTSKHYGDENGNNHRADAQEIVNFLRKGGHYPLNEGTLNLYKLFCEEIISNLSSRDGLVGLLVPQTLLNDKQSTKLRKAILRYRLGTIFIVPESNRFFSGITQSLCLLGLSKKGSSDSLKVVPAVSSITDFDKPSVEIEKTLLEDASNSMPIIALDKKGWGIMKKLHHSPHLKDIPQLKNLRGELDLTLNKEAIVDHVTPWPLIRGSNLKLFSHTLSSRFITEEFALKNPKSEYSQIQRIACQQISNINSRKRLKFSLIEPNSILGNSCNFIAVDEGSIWRSSGISLKYLLGILNSNILEWRFRVTSSNNHVGNHELGNLPITMPTKLQQSKVENLVNLTLEDQSAFNLSMLNAYVAELYELESTEFDFIQNQTVPNTSQGGLI